MNRSLAIALILLAAFGGFFGRGWTELGHDDHNDHHAAEDGHDDHDDDHGDEHEEHDEHEEEPHVALTEEAFKTLRLKLGQVAVADFQRTTSIPAEVAEFPGVSAYKLAAPVHGVVTAVAAEPGASVAPGDALFEVQITDERVLDAQLQLLEALTRLEIVNEELDRLQPLAASGAVSGRQRRDLDYERRELETTIRLRRDELIVRGLPDEQVNELIDSQRLLRSVVVRVPPRSRALAQAVDNLDAPAVRTVAWQEEVAEDDFSIESLLVQPGQTVERGEALCDLASHARLYLRVKAFERDVPLLAGLAESGAPLSAEFGHSLESHGPTSSVVSDLRVRYVANHVEPGSQSYACFVPLQNELLHESTGPTGRRYRTWRFSVGQRAHLLLPTDQIAGHIPLPAEAVAIEGPNAFVFRPHEHDEDEDHHDDHDDEQHAEDDHEEGHEDDDHHDHEEAFLEVEPVPVTVLHRDNRTVVVATGGELQPGDEIAMNAAYQLHLALDAGEDGGGHHHHHH